MRSGTPRVQGYPTPHSDMGGGGGRLSRLAKGHRACAAWPLLPGTAAAPSPPKRDGVRAPGLGRLLGCAAMRQRAVTYGQRNRQSACQRHNTPAPGWREPPRGADGPQPGAAWTRQRQALLGWAGANTTHCAQRLTRTPVVTAPAVTTHTNGCWACGLLLHAVSNRPHAQGKWAQDITGVACSGAPKQSFSGSLWPRYMRQPVMLSWPSANLPRRPARLGRARCPDWPAIRCSARHAPSFDCSDAGSNHYRFNSWWRTFHEGYRPF